MARGILANPRAGLFGSGGLAGGSIGCQIRRKWNAGRFSGGVWAGMPGVVPPEEEEDEEDAERMTITGGSLKEELLHLVEDNPEVAANVIRGWVGDAA